jgi:Domain of unknown function DUF29
MSTLTPTLYATDYYRWLEETVTRLQERDFDAVDWENLIEEVSDLGKSQKNAVKSLMIRLVGKNVQRAKMAFRNRDFPQPNSG